MNFWLKVNEKYEMITLEELSVLYIALQSTSTSDEIDHDKYFTEEEQEEVYNGDADIFTKLLKERWFEDKEFDFKGLVMSELDWDYNYTKDAIEGKNILYYEEGKPVFENLDENQKNEYKERVKISENLIEKLANITNEESRLLCKAIESAWGFLGIGSIELGFKLESGEISKGKSGEVYY
jgi:hypothetical protein